MHGQWQLVLFSYKQNLLQNSQQVHLAIRKCRLKFKDAGACWVENNSPI